MDKESVHSRYKDLAMVESAFRTCKTGHLEVRPIDLHQAGRTRAHVFVVMLSYLFIRELRECWREVDGTVEEPAPRIAKTVRHDKHTTAHNPTSRKNKCGHKKKIENMS